MAAAQRPLWYNGPNGEGPFNVKDTKQFEAWEASWGLHLEAIAPARRGVNVTVAPKADTRMDNDDLNYEAWLAHTAAEADEDIRNADAFQASIAQELAADDAFQAFITTSWKAATPVRKPVTEDGMYRMADGTIAKVQIAVNGSGNLYAKRLIVSDDHGSFEYEPGLIRKLSADDRMTVEQAAEFGKLYGWCCVCGRTLTDEKSIAAGIGPVCGGRI